MRHKNGPLLAGLLTLLLLFSTGVSQSTSPVPINVTIFDAEHSEVVPDDTFTQSAEAIYASTNGWLITLQGIISPGLSKYARSVDPSNGCYVVRVVEISHRLFLEVECATDAKPGEGNTPEFVEKLEQALLGQGDLIVEETSIFHNHATQPSAPWGVDRVDERELPLDGVYSYDHTGAGVEIFVADTGIRTTHVAFGGRARNAFNAVTGNVDTRANTDCNGHGTFVASVAGGQITGTAKAASLVGVVMLDCNGRANTGMIATGLSYIEAYARSYPGKKIVVNLSFGGPYSQTIDAHASSLAALSNVIVVAAAGNEATNACTRSPASSRYVMTVGATDIRDGLARFTNTGRCVNITAPGVQIRGASHTSDILTTVGSGTSFSSPLTAGVAALTFQQASSASASAQVAEVVYNWARVRAFFPQIISEAIYDPWKSGIDYRQDISDTISRAEAALNYPFLYSRIHFASPPPHDNVDGNDPLYPPNNATRVGDIMSSLWMIAFSAGLVWAM